jgi:hypothetical protein
MNATLLGVIQMNATLLSVVLLNIASLVIKVSMPWRSCFWQFLVTVKEEKML